jgi:hypothetical protein
MGCWAVDHSQRGQKAKGSRSHQQLLDKLHGGSSHRNARLGLHTLPTCWIDRYFFELMVRIF